MTPEGITVEFGQVGDARAFLALQEQIFQEGFWFITEADEMSRDPARMEGLIRNVKTSRNSLFLVARHEGRVVGSLLLQAGPLRRMRHVARLEMYVHHNHRGRGVGGAMLDTCIAWARKNPFLEKISLAVYTSNERAVHLYRSRGFETEGHRLGEYRLSDGTYLDDFLMFLRV